MNDDLNSVRVLKIFENLGYELVDTAVGTAIVMEPGNAFVFSAISGASYLDDSQFPFTAKGLTKLFNAAFSTKPVWGLLDGQSLGYTPKNISETRPYIFDGPKHVVPVDTLNEDMARTWQEQTRGKLKKPEHCMLFRIETWKKGNGMEPLLEYLACHRFRDMGFLVETQVPLSATTGSPDFLAIRDDDLFDAISKYFREPFLGCHLIELAMFCIANIEYSPWPGSADRSLPSSIQTVVGEAKVGGSNPVMQLEKYLSTRMFSQQLALLDRSPSLQKDILPTLFVSSEDNVVVKNLDKSLSTYRESELKRYLEWYRFVSKCYLLVNFDHDRIMEINREYGLPASTSIAKSIMQLAELLNAEAILQHLPANV